MFTCGKASGSILIIPASEKGKGGGHLCRCLTLTNELRAMGREAFLFITPQTRDLTGLYHSMNFNPKWCITNEELEIRNEELKESFEFIILDRFQTPLDELLRWEKIAPVIGIDEGGGSRDKFDFLIDILIPEKLGKPAANITSPSLLFKIDSTTNKQNLTTPEWSDAQTEKILQTNSSCGSWLKNKNNPLKILITFGQEDSAGLGLKTANALSSMKNKPEMDITLLRGALAENNEQRTENKEAIQNVRILEGIPQLAQHLCEYDLVITHYGITAYEALYAGTSVLLAHPTSYHRKLAKAAGFCSLEISHNYSRKGAEIAKNAKGEIRLSKISLRSLRLLCAFARLNLSENFLLELKEHNAALVKKLKLRESSSLSGLISIFSPKVNRLCPVCGAESGYSISRFNDRTYRRCSKCGIICMDRINPAPVEYEKEYFFEFYKRQYGKTYLEDFDKIKEAGQRRLKIISKICGKKNDSDKLSLFDIGCAYGPFLAAAREKGFSVTGIDPAEDAVKYVQEKLGISAVQGFFPIHSPLLIPHSFNVITLWFVIEHFADCVSVLAEIKKLLKPGGILAFSTPSFSGISGRSSIRRFLSASPADHWTVWSPKTCKKALALAGFKVKKIVISGHHPQRFPLFGKFAKSRKSPLFWILLAISKLFTLGDTFEVYAQKT